MKREIANTERDLSRLNEHYTDEVTDRVVRSRTDPSGEVEFVDPVSTLKLLNEA
jgi:hypothetical protein